MKKATPSTICLLLLAIYTVSAQNEFITTWKTDNPGVSNNTSITIPTRPQDHTYSYDVDWTYDGVTFNAESIGVAGNITHDYGVAGTYTVAIRGTFPQIRLTNSDPKKLLTIEQWGNISWATMSHAFLGCSNLRINATDAPDLSNVTNVSNMFFGCTSLNDNINHWNVSNVTKMFGMFDGATSFNQPLDSWNVGNATDMASMFDGATSFNQPLDSWNVGNATDMSSMFSGASSFNQPLNNWNVGNVRNMPNMFNGATSFNQPLGNWNVSNAINIHFMFNGATSFNQPLGNWNVGNAIFMQNMFNGATSFNQPLGNWNVGNVRNMQSMFNGATSFNQPLGNWNVGNVRNMVEMLSGASAFDQPLGDWDLSRIINISGMLGFLENSGLSTSNYDSTLIGWATDSSGTSGDGNDDIPTGIFINFGTSLYCSAATERQTLTADTNANGYGWSITDAGACPTTGTVVISEIMQNPAAVADTHGEYFELYNPGTSAINLKGWNVSIGLGSVTPFSITPDLAIYPGDFLVLGNNSDSGTNGGVSVDYQYTSGLLSNSAGRIIIQDATNAEVDRVDYDGGPLWPNPNGAAMIFTGTDNQGNNDASLWTTATASEGISPDFGSPGTNGTGQVIDLLIYSGGSWSTAPTNNSGFKKAIIRATEAVTFASNVTLESLEIENDADVTVNTGVTLTTPTVTLKSTSTKYASLISDGRLTGDVHYQRHVNNTAASGGNDLISPPVVGETFDNFIANNANLVSNTANTLYLFGPFDKTTGAYLTYSNTETAMLIPGLGYRAAATGTNGGTLNFQGTGIHQGTVTQGVANSGPFFAPWNLVGNPYPSYLKVQDFLNDTTNSGLIDPTNLAIYGYNGEASNRWVIYNLANTDADTAITPGQGFFIAVRSTVSSSASIQFTTGMRSHGTTDDFISGRNNSSTNHHLKMQLGSDSQNYSTDFYFNTNSTGGLDPGYDAAVFGNTTGNFALYSHLVEDSQGIDFAIQSLPMDFLSGGTTIPLGVNAASGQSLTLGIETSSLPNGIDVYLIDSEANTSTHLNTAAYAFTTTSDLSTTGRFFLQFANTTLSDPEFFADGFKVYALRHEKKLLVEGVQQPTVLQLFDVNGRLVKSVRIDASDAQRQVVDLAKLTQGLYIAKLTDGQRSHTQKIVVD